MTVRQRFERDPADIITLQQHILEQQRSHPTATGEFSWLLTGVTFATRVIEAQVRRAGLLNVLGGIGQANIHGEDVQKLDVLADKCMIKFIRYRGCVGIMASEEQKEPIVVKDDPAEGKYIVLFDPLDGSSNIDVNVSIGTIFSIFKRATPPEPRRTIMEDLLQPGTQQLAAGYVVYGSSTVMAYTTGQGVHMFTLDPMIGAYILSRENVRMPEDGKIYSVNEANYASFPKGVQEYLSWCKSKEAGPYTSRYIGSLVADFHRTLLRGGIFLYPATAKDPGGKLRLMYEANPMAFLAEQGGGAASDGQSRILDKQPKALHERTPLIIGARPDVDRVLSYLRR